MPLFFFQLVTCSVMAPFTATDYDSMGSVQTEYQNHCMYAFLGVSGTVPARLLLALRVDAGSSGADPCDWGGVTCVNRSVTAIYWPISQFADIPSLQWLPGSLRSIEMRQAKIHGEMQTRLLPRDLVDCTLVDCGIHSTLELRSLPAKLEQLILNGNDIRGTVHLTNLPADIRCIELMRTGVSRVVVCNSRLPEKLEHVAVYRKRRRVPVVCLDSADADSRIEIAKRDNRVDTIFMPACTYEEYHQRIYEHS